MNRPAVTGLSPERLSRTQSAASTTSKRSALAAAEPAAAATSARNAFRSGSLRKVNRDAPASAAGIHKRHRNLVAVEGLGGEGRNAARSIFTGYQQRDRRRLRFG